MFTISFSNYGPTIFAQQIAQEKGCSQCLWLYNDEVSCSSPTTLYVIPKMMNICLLTLPSCCVFNRSKNELLSSFLVSSFSSRGCNSRPIPVSIYIMLRVLYRAFTREKGKTSFCNSNRTQLTQHSQFMWTL